MSPDNRDRTRDLIAAAGGRVLEKRDLRLLLKNPDRSSSSVKPRRPCYFVYDVDPPGEFCAGSLREEMEEAREQAAAGAQVICHLRVLDAVAAYDAEILLIAKKDRFVTS
jgi:BRCA1-associated RING domain protein 1